MDFFKVKKFLKAPKPDPEKDSGDKQEQQPEEPQNGKSDDMGRAVNERPANEAGDDDDFILNEVKRKLKELRRNSFMMLIPEEPSVEDEKVEEEAAETSSSEWRDVEAEAQRTWYGFDAIYEKYHEEMLFFDRLSAQQLQEVGDVLVKVVEELEKDDS